MTFTTISRGFWQDGDVMSWTPELKFFFIYLCTNPRATWIGIYEAPLKLMEVETGYNWETVLKLIKELERQGKIVYSETTREIAVCNWLKYHKPDNGNVIKAMRSTKDKVKNHKLLFAVEGLAEVLKLETPTEPLGNPLGTVTEPLGRIEIEIEKEIEIETYKYEYGPAGAEPSPIREKNEPVSKKPTKHKHGEFKNVLLTAEEFTKLLQDFENSKEGIEYLSEYKTRTGKKYASDYLALRKWVFDAVREEQLKKPKKAHDVYF